MGATSRDLILCLTVCSREDAQAYINGSSVSTPPSRVAPSSRQSSATSSLKSVTPKTRHSRKGKPYERPSNAARSTQKDAQVRGKQPYQYKRLDMQWTPQVERDLIKDGWLIAFTDGGCSSAYSMLFAQSVCLIGTHRQRQVQSRCWIRRLLGESAQCTVRACKESACVSSLILRSQDDI